MKDEQMQIVILGLSITSAWGNGHATTYRALVRELVRKGHDVIFLERDKPWYANHRDLPKPTYGKCFLYSSLEELRDRFTDLVKNADAVIVGSYVPEGTEVGRWVNENATGVKAFYDIDTPVTLTKLKEGDTEYISKELIPLYDLYLSFTGGPTLKVIERKWKSPKTRALYCSVDVQNYFPEKTERQWDLGYLGTYSSDRQPKVNELLFTPAKQLPEQNFILAGPQYPSELVKPKNLMHLEHLPPQEHRRFYNRQRFTLNVTRADMAVAGYSPSVRLFEAAACGTPIISDSWSGLETVFKPNEEILIAHSSADVVNYLTKVSEAERVSMGGKARERILARHTSAHRAAELEFYLFDTLDELARNNSSHAGFLWKTSKL